MTQAWQRVIPEPAPCARAVNPRGLIDLGWNRAETAEEDQHDERTTTPDIDHDHGGHRRGPEPAHRSKPEHIENFVQGAVVVVEHRDPEKSRDQCRVYPGEYDRAVHERGHAVSPVFAVIHE